MSTRKKNTLKDHNNNNKNNDDDDDSKKRKKISIQFSFSFGTFFPLKNKKINKSFKLPCCCCCCRRYFFPSVC